MKNGIKIMLCAAFLLVAVGGLMITAAVVKGNFDIDNRKGLSDEMKTFEVTEVFTDIQIEDVESNIHLLPAADGECRVLCPEKPDGSIYYTVTVRGGELSVQRHDNRKWYQHIGVSFGSQDVEVYLPEKAYGQLTARSTSGSIRVDEGFTFENARLESTSGSVKGTLLSGKKFITDSTSGSVRVPHSAAGGECEISTTSGNIDIEIKQ